ncbi:MAG: hydrogenase expression/formation protein [Myxococcales bacterium]|nr:hydrogenase expression/formation protein [Myxococcales bacterium]
MKPVFALPLLHEATPEAELGNQQAFGGLLSPEPAGLRPVEGEPGTRECLPLLQACRKALARAAATGEGFLLPLENLSPEASRALDEALGEGEVTLTVGGRHRYEASETALPGLWRVTTKDGARVLSRHLEVGDVPHVVRAAEETATLKDLHIGQPPQGAMNALPVLAELRHRSQAWQPGQPNHVLSFTLLPMNEVDVAYLEQQVGHGPVRGESKGFSRCAVELTAVRHVWSVKHFNAMDKLILDTLEVGDVPQALLAASDDFLDSAARLSEWLGRVPA